MALTTFTGPTHPLTGEPIVPLYVDRHGRARWPIMGAEDDPDAAAKAAAEKAAADKAAADKAAADKAAEDAKGKGFPADTPLEQMTSEQREAYWKHYARQHEQRVKDFGNLTPEQLAELREKAGKHDALEEELATDAEKAVKKAQADADAKYQPMLVETAFRSLIGDRNARLEEGKRKSDSEIDDFLADLNLTRFVTATGTVDTAKVLARVEQFTPVTGTQQQSRGPGIPGGGSGGSGRSGGGSVAAVMEERRAERAAREKARSS